MNTVIQERVREISDDPRMSDLELNSQHAPVHPFLAGMYYYGRQMRKGEGNFYYSKSNIDNGSRYKGLSPYL